MLTIAGGIILALVILGAFLLIVSLLMGIAGRNFAKNMDRDAKNYSKVMDCLEKAKTEDERSKPDQ